MRPTDHPLLADLKRKDFIAGCDLKDKDVANAAFIDLVSERFASTKPLMLFLCAAMGLT